MGEAEEDAPWFSNRLPDWLSALCPAACPCRSGGPLKKRKKKNWLSFSGTRNRGKCFHFTPLPPLPLNPPPLMKNDPHKPCGLVLRLDVAAVPALAANNIWSHLPGIRPLLLRFP